MFLNRAADGTNNISGRRIAELRLARCWSQRVLADHLQEIGLDIDKNSIQRIECGKGFVTDIELLAFAKVLEVDISSLLQ